MLAAHLPASASGAHVRRGCRKGSGLDGPGGRKRWAVDAPLDGIAVTRYQHGLATQRIRV